MENEFNKLYRHVKMLRIQTAILFVVLVASLIMIWCGD